MHAEHHSVPELSLQWPPVELIDRVSIKAPSTGHQCSQAGCSVVGMWMINSSRPCTQVQHAMCCGSLHQIRAPLGVCSPTMPAVVHESSAGRAHDCEAAPHICAAVFHDRCHQAACAASALPGAETYSFFGASGSQTCADIRSNEHSFTKQHRCQAVNKSGGLAGRQRRCVPCMLGGNTSTCRSDWTAGATDGRFCRSLLSRVQPCTLHQSWERRWHMHGCSPCTRQLLPTPHTCSSA